ncbi:hypothetical protein HRbin02_01096 [Candidatus Calditenuaceae archaeon HR02]|nr:hypothetical protein HRbin02_01096 [Candidatus Calditenuaceae archaeon HR02]
MGKEFLNTGSITRSRRMRIETLTGIILVTMGIILLLIGIAPRLLESIPKLHPIVYTQISVGKLKIGTSPLAIIILTILYLLFALRG